MSRNIGKSADTRISLFAGISQALETSGKLLCRLCTEAVRGSNPLRSTFKKRHFAGKTGICDYCSEYLSGICAATRSRSWEANLRFTVTNVLGLHTRSAGAPVPSYLCLTRLSADSNTLSKLPRPPASETAVTSSGRRPDCCLHDRDFDT